MGRRGEFGVTRCLVRASLDRFGPARLEAAKTKWTQVDPTWPDQAADHEQKPMSAPVPLPIDAVRDAIVATLDAGSRAVLVAPPGAGKTTRVPLMLLDRP